MADKKISELDALTGANTADDDRLVIVDTSAGLTKNITMTEFKNALDTGSGFVRITGDTMTGDLSFGDNDKAIFGAGSDLQIYHDGAHSYISDQGTGHLKVFAEHFFVNNSDDTEQMIGATVNGAVDLFFNGSKKLATTSTGVDITGTLTSDGLETLHTSGDVGYRLGYNSGSSAFIHRDSATGNYLLQSDETGSSWKIETDNGSGPLTRLEVDRYGDINFYASDGTTQAFHWDAADESLGIGTTTPSAPLQVTQTPSDTVGNVGISLKDVNNAIEFGLRLDNTSRDLMLDRYYAGAWYNHMSFDRSTGNVGIGTSSPTAGFRTSIKGDYSSIIGGIEFDSGGGDKFTIGHASATSPSGRLNVVGAGNLIMQTNNTERLRIDSSGNVGIGTSSPNSVTNYTGLTINNGTYGGFIDIENNGAHTFRLISNTTGSYIRTVEADPLVFDTADTERMRISAVGDLELIQSNNLYWKHAGGGTIRAGINADSSDNLTFSTGSSDTTRMTLDGSGNVGIAAVPEASYAPSLTIKYGGNNITSRGNADFRIMSGAFQDGASTFEYSLSSIPVAMLSMTNGVYSFAQAPAGTDGNAVSFSNSMTLDASGNLLVGKTAQNHTSVGHTLYPAGGISVVRSGGQCAVLNRLSSDGTIIDLRKDGTTAGSIGTYFGNLMVGKESGARIAFSSTGIYSSNNSGTTEDGSYSLGTASSRFTDLHLSGNVNVENGKGITTTGGLKYIADSDNNAPATGLIHQFLTDSTSVAASIDKTGNLLVASTDNSPATNNVAGSSHGSLGNIQASVDGNPCLFVNRKSSDGDIISFRKDGSAVGSIGSYSGAGMYTMAPTNGGSGLLFYSNAAPIYPIQNVSGTATISNGVADLGAAVHRFKDLYLSGGVYLGGTGSANKLDDYEEGTFTPDYHGTGTYGTTTFSSRRGSYTKIGNQVTVQMQMTVTATTATSSAVITGLPFANNGTHNAVGTVMAEDYNFSSSTGWVTTYLVTGSADDLRLYLTSDNVAWARQDVDGSFGMYLMLTYTAA